MLRLEACLEIICTCLESLIELRLESAYDMSPDPCHGLPLTVSGSAKIQLHRLTVSYLQRDSPRSVTFCTRSVLKNQVGRPRLIQQIESSAVSILLICNLCVCTGRSDESDFCSRNIGTSYAHAMFACSVISSFA